VQEPREVHVQLLREGVDTMAEMLHYVAKLHEQKRCLGTREILAEEDEIQPNKRVFKKVRCWMNCFLSLHDLSH
jgi:long-chain acyl-CoA synthetase